MNVSEEKSMEKKLKKFKEEYAQWCELLNGPLEFSLHITGTRKYIAVDDVVGRQILEAKIIDAEKLIVAQENYMESMGYEFTKTVEEVTGPGTNAPSGIVTTGERVA